jgi:predicted nuclease with TOPRIM domain
MDAPVIVAIIGVLAAPVAAFVTWLLNRKKHIADIYNALSESSQTAVETMQLTMQELRLELVEARQKIEELIEENGLLREDLAALKKQNEELMQQIHDMRVAYEMQSQPRDN